MEDDKITLDRETFKALAVDSRVKILRILDDRQHTLTDLAEELGMAPSTIKEHLDTLVAAGLIKQVDKGMKWKYYKLTSKGKELLNPYEKKVWIVLATSLLALAVSAYAIFSRLKGFGKITVIENYIPEPTSFVQDKAMQGAGEEFLRNAPASASGLSDTLWNASATTFCDGDKLGAAALDTTNRTMQTIGEGVASTAGCDMIQEMKGGVNETLSGLSTTMSSALNTVATTLADAANQATGAFEPSSITSTQTRVLETSQQLPYAEIALFAVCALLAGLCIGYLIKKKRGI
jgi:DNA-binding transcriptional ArsR family regulator